MKKSAFQKYLILPLIVLGLIVFYSCSGDEGPIEKDQEEPKDTAPDIVVIASDDNVVYQLDINLETEVVNTSNLTQLHDISGSYKEIITHKEQVAFLYGNRSEYSWITKEYEGGVVQKYDQVCDFVNGNEESFNYTTAIEGYLLVFTRTFDDQVPLLSVVVQSLKTGDCKKVIFGRGHHTTNSKIVYSQGQILVEYQDADNKFAISWVDLENGESTTKSFEKYYSATIQEGVVHMLFVGDNSTSYEACDPKDWKIIGSEEFLADRTFGTYGIVQTQKYMNELLFEAQYAQPSRVGRGPATLNLSTGKYGLQSELLNKLAEKIIELNIGKISLIKTYDADIKTRTILVGYELTDEQGNTTGGLLKSNFDGNISNNILLPYSPVKILRLE